MLEAKVPKPAAASQAQIGHHETWKLAFSILFPAAVKIDAVEIKEDVLTVTMNQSMGALLKWHYETALKNKDALAAHLGYDLNLDIKAAAAGDAKGAAVGGAHKAAAAGGASGAGIGEYKAVAAGGAKGAAVGGAQKAAVAGGASGAGIGEHKAVVAGDAKCVAVEGEHKAVKTKELPKLYDLDPPENTVKAGKKIFDAMFANALKAAGINGDELFADGEASVHNRVLYSKPQQPAVAAARVWESYLAVFRSYLNAVTSDELRRAYLPSNKGGSPLPGGAELPANRFGDLLQRKLLGIRDGLIFFDFGLAYKLIVQPRLVYTVRDDHVLDYTFSISHLTAYIVQLIQNTLLLKMGDKEAMALFWTVESSDIQEHYVPLNLDYSTSMIYAEDGETPLKVHDLEGKPVRDFTANDLKEIYRGLIDLIQPFNPIVPLSLFSDGIVAATYHHIRDDEKQAQAVRDVIGSTALAAATELYRSMWSAISAILHGRLTEKYIVSLIVISDGRDNDKQQYPVSEQQVLDLIAQFDKPGAPPKPYAITVGLGTSYDAILKKFSDAMCGRHLDFKDAGSLPEIANHLQTMSSPSQIVYFRDGKTAQSFRVQINQPHVGPIKPTIVDGKAEFTIDQRFSYTATVRPKLDTRLAASAKVLQTPGAGAVLGGGKTQGQAQAQGAGAAGGSSPAPGAAAGAGAAGSLGPGTVPAKKR